MKKFHTQGMKAVLPLYASLLTFKSHLTGNRPQQKNENSSRFERIGVVSASIFRLEGTRKQGSLAFIHNESTLIAAWEALKQDTQPYKC